MSARSAYVLPAGGDTITVLRVRGGKRLAKVIRRDGTIEDYDSAFTYDLFERPVADLTALHRLVLLLLHRPDCCIVRGVPIDPERTIGIRRLAYLDKKTGEAPTLRDVPHYWCALDMDGIERPESLPASDLLGCAAEAIQRLPIAFGRARCIVQASASHGIKPGCRLRLWYWLARPATGTELIRWLRDRPADPAVFRTVQPIYTAAPVFESGGRDTLPQRIAELPGEPMVSVPSPEALALPPRRLGQLPTPGASGAGRYAFAALVNAASRVGRAGIGDRHATILREARSLARLITAGLLTEHAVSETLLQAGTDAGKPDKEIESVFAWAMDHPSAAALPEGLVQ